MVYYSQHTLVCINQKQEGKTCCAQSGGILYFNYLKERLQCLKIWGEGKVRASYTGCLGRCAKGPCMVIYPEGIWYTYKSFADIDIIIDQYIIHHTVVKSLLINE